MQHFVADGCESIVNYRLQETQQISDEIDLVDLFKALWARKLLIMLCTFAGLAVAVIYALLAAEQWKSVAFISRPRVNNISEYLEQRRTLARADDNHVVDRDVLASNLFSEWIRQATSEASKRAFFRNHPYLVEFSDGDATGYDPMLIAEASENLTLSKPEEDSLNPHYVLSFTASSPEQAQRVLVDYLADSNRRAIAILDGEYKDALTASVQTRKTERDVIERQLLTQRGNWIEELTAALNTAQAAGVKNYMEGRAISGSVVVELTERQRLFMLGETYLAAELKTAENSPIVYPTRYYEIEQQLALLEPLMDYRAPEIQAFRYLLEPTLPFKRESPKRTLIAALGIVLGGMLGIFAALILSMVQRQPRPIKTLDTTAPVSLPPISA